MLSAECCVLWLRRDLPDNTLAVGSAVPGCAVEVPGRVNQYATEWIPAIATEGEVVKRAIAPTAVGSCQLENRTRCVLSSASGRTVEIAGGIDSERVLGTEGVKGVK